MQQGPYLADYRLLSLAGISSWAYSVARLSFFLLPLVLLALLGWLRNREWRRAYWKNPGERSWALFLLSFAAGYLFLVTPKGAAGYLQIPVGLAALLFLFPSAVKGIEAAKKLAPSVMALFLVAWMAFGLFSIQRWSSYAHGINEVSLVFPELVRSPDPRLVIVHGAEMADILRRGAADEGWAQVKIVESGDFHEEDYRDYKGEVLLLEPTRYFDPLPAAYVLRLGEWVGGWKSVSASSPSYRAYFGAK
jgi:hypothetical protein